MIEPTPEGFDPIDEDTLDDRDAAQASTTRSQPNNNLAIVDIDEGAELTLYQGPPDTSRLWIQLHTDTASLHLTIAEGAARKLHDHLGHALSRFHRIRNGHR
jgi:hypothetical protein